MRVRPNPVIQPNHPSILSIIYVIMPNGLDILLLLVVGHIL